MNGYILLGSPGSGKGTLGQFLASFDLHHIASGDILRSEIKNGTNFGKKTKELVAKGKQVPDEIISKLVFQKLEECIAQQKPFILDGFPQTLPQLENLKAFLRNHPDCKITTICLEIEPAIALKRITGRISCMECDTTYHQKLSPPMKEGLCDHCEYPLTVRSGDNPKNAKKRLEQFEQTTKKVIDCVRQYKSVASIDGNQSIVSIREELLNFLKNDSR